MMMKKYPDSLKPLLDRIDPAFERTISCDKGWWDLLVSLHKEIMELDPNYGIYQVKEKYGTLRFYYRCSGPQQAKWIDKIIARYERISSLTCEVTGGAGQLMQRGLQYKTLHRSFEEEGWMPVDRIS